MSNKNEVFRGWHFLASDKKLGYNDGRKVKKHEWVKAKGVSNKRPCCCDRGMHASLLLRDAITFRDSDQTILCIVDVKGRIDSKYDKFCGDYRKVVEWFDLSEIDKKHIVKIISDNIHLYIENCDYSDVVIDALHYVTTGQLPKDSTLIQLVFNLGEGIGAESIWDDDLVYNIVSYIEIPSTKNLLKIMFQLIKAIYNDMPHSLRFERELAQQLMKHLPVKMQKLSEGMFQDFDDNDEDQEGWED